MLKTFNKKDFRLFDRFIASPYFNKDQNLLLLFRSIVKYAPNFTHKNLERKKLFEITFKKEKYDEKQLGYYMSDLMRLAEKYCAQQELETDKINYQTKGLINLLKRDLKIQFDSYLREAEKVNKQNKLKNAEFHYNQYLLEIIKHDSFAEQKKRTDNELVYSAIKSLDTFYISEKLRLSCQILNRKNVFSVEFEDVLIEDIIKHLENQNEIKEPAINVYYHIYKAMIEPTEEKHFRNFKKSITENIVYFNKKESVNIYLYAINYAIRKVNSGNENFINELYLLYKNGIEQQIIFTKGKLTPWTFKNMVTLSLRLEKYEWVENFIETYLPFLDEEHKENTYTYSKCNLYFHKKQFEKAHIELLQLQFTDIYYHLDSKVLLAKIYFELNESLALNSHLDNFKVYIRKNKLISDSVKENYSNFAIYLKKTYNLDINKAKAVNELKKQLESQKNISDRNWLIGKIEEKTVNKKMH